MPRVTITAPDKNAQPYRFQLDREIVTIGRGSDNDIVVDSGSVSTSHAEMRRVLGGYELTDVGSTNGLKVDDHRYETVPLYQGSSVRLGDVTFDFSLGDDELDFLANEAAPVIAPASLPQASLPAASIQPAAQARPVPRREVVVMRDEKSGGGVFMTLVLLIFAIAAFGVGAAIRHQKDTGGSLVDRVKAKFLVEKKVVEPAVVAPAEGEAPAAAAPAPAAEAPAQ